jgi:hypothetical protein
LIFLVCLLNSPAFAQKTGSGAQKLYSISGTITHTQSYCGGARPTDEMLAQYNTPTPLAGKKLYIRSGTENSLKRKVLHQIVSDGTGHFSLKLPSGTYCILVQEQVKKLNKAEFRKKATDYLTLDENCLNQWWKTCYLSFEVKDTEITDLKINFNTPCFTDGTPCLNYVGPMPP